MNIGNATIRVITPWWQLALYVLAAVLTLCTAGSAAMLIRTKKKAKND